MRDGYNTMVTLFVKNVFVGNIIKNAENIQNYLVIVRVTPVMEAPKWILWFANGYSASMETSCKYFANCTACPTFFKFEYICGEVLETQPSIFDQK
jgi:hypothetical protein